MSILSNIYESATKFYDELYDHQKPKALAGATVATVVAGHLAISGVTDLAKDVFNLISFRNEHACIVNVPSTMGGGMESETIIVHATDEAIKRLDLPCGPRR